MELKDGSGTDIQKQRDDANNTPMGAVHPVNAAAAGEHRQVSLAGLSSSGYVFTWRAHTPYDDIQARRHGVDGAPAGPQVQVNTFTGMNGGGRSQPVAAALAGGGYAIAWMSQFQDPGRSVDNYLQRFGDDGAPLGMETRASSDTSATALGAAIVGLAGGGFVVTWSFSGPGGEFVVAQRFAAEGSRLGE